MCWWEYRERVGETEEKEEGEPFDNVWVCAIGAGLSVAVDAKLGNVTAAIVVEA